MTLPKHLRALKEGITFSGKAHLKSAHSTRAEGLVAVEKHKIDVAGTSKTARAAFAIGRGLRNLLKLSSKALSAVVNKVQGKGHSR